MPDHKKDEPESRWTFGTTTVITIVALVVGFVQYGTTSAFSVRQPFLEMQSNLCRSAAEHTARLASTRDPVTWQKSREEFWMLYWGPLGIVEDVESHGKTRVEAAMVRFGDDLKLVDPSSPHLPLSSLEDRAIDVAHACRDLLSIKWNTGILRWFKY